MTGLGGERKIRVDNQERLNGETGLLLIPGFKPVPE